MLIRHAQSEANVRAAGDGQTTAVGHSFSPLTPKGIKQSLQLAVTLENDYGIIPGEYDEPVAASEFLRPQQTAQHSGFKKVHIQPVLNEIDVPVEFIPNRGAIRKHAAERWIPDDGGRVQEFLTRVRDRDMDYQIYFTHGLFIAGVRKALETEVGIAAYPQEFDSERGYIPLQTGIVRLVL